MLRNAIVCFVFFVLGLFVAVGLRAALASAPEPEPKPEPPPPSQQTGLLVDLGNETCPIMDGAVDGKTYLEWNHLRVGFCCPGCDKRFRQDPEAALDATGVAWREAVAAIEAYRDAPPEHKAHQLVELKEKWRVVREGDAQ